MSDQDVNHALKVETLVLYSFLEMHHVVDFVILQFLHNCYISFH